LRIRVGQGIARDLAFDYAQIVGETFMFTQVPLNRVGLVRRESLRQ